MQASREAAHRDSHYLLSCSITMAEAESPPARAEFDSRSLSFTDAAQVSLALPEQDQIEPRLGLLARASAKAFDGCEVTTDG